MNMRARCGTGAGEIGSPVRLSFGPVHSTGRMWLLALVATSALLNTVASAHAAEGGIMLPVADVLNDPTAKGKLDGTVAFYFGETAYPRPAARFGEFVTNKKTNAFAKDDVKSCKWVMLSALISLQERAKQQGGNAVVNIRSFFKSQTVSHNTSYECHPGFLMAGVALKGEVVRLGR